MTLDDGRLLVSSIFCLNFVMQLSLSISLGELQVRDLGAVPTGVLASSLQADHFSEAALVDETLLLALP